MESATGQIPDVLLRTTDLLMISVPAMPEMLIADCLKADGRVICYRSPRLDSLLTRRTPAVGRGLVRYFELGDEGKMTSEQMLRASLMVGPGPVDREQRRNVSAWGRTFHPEQVADLARRTKTNRNRKSEETGLVLEHDKANLFLIEDEAEGIFVLNIHYYHLGCDVDVYPLDSDQIWPRGTRLFARIRLVKRSPPVET